MSDIVKIVDRTYTVSTNKEDAIADQAVINA